MKHIVFINQHFAPDFAATGQLLSELCVDLSRKGWKISVITGVPSPGTYPTESYIPLTEENGRLTIYRLKHLHAEKTSLISRLFHFFSFWLSSIVKVVSIEKIDMIFIMSTPPLLNGVTANLLRIIRQIPYIYNVQDLYPGIAVELGAIKKGFTYHLSTKIENYIYQHATMITTLSEQLKKSISERSVAPEKIAVIPNWADGDMIRPISSSDLKKKNGFEGKFVVGYSGNIGLSQELEKLIPFLAKYTIQFEPNIHYLIIGDGAKKRELEIEVKNNQLTNVTMWDFQPKEKLHESLSLPDIHLIPLKRNLSNYLVPSKTYGILAVEKPILALVEPNSELGTLIQTQSCGAVCDPDNYDSVLHLILQWEKDPEKLKLIGKNGHHIFMTTYERKITSEKYHYLFSKVLGVN